MSLDTLLEAAKYIEYRSEAKARGEIPQDYQTFALQSKAIAAADEFRIQARQQLHNASRCDNSSDSYSSNHCDDGREKRRSGGRRRGEEQTYIDEQTMGSLPARTGGTREVHNKLEKNRRAHLKECFETLKRQLPNMDDRKTSNLTILRGALRYIQSLKRREREYEHEMERLAREKIAAQQRLATLKKDLSLQLDYLDMSALLPEKDNETTTTASECGNYSDLDEDLDEKPRPQPSSVSPASSPKPALSFLCDVAGNSENGKPPIFPTNHKLIDTLNGATGSSNIVNASSSSALNNIGTNITSVFTSSTGHTTAISGCGATPVVVSGGRATAPRASPGKATSPMATPLLSVTNNSKMVGTPATPLGTSTSLASLVSQQQSQVVTTPASLGLVSASPTSVSGTAAMGPSIPAGTVQVVASPSGTVKVIGVAPAPSGPTAGASAPGAVSSTGVGGGPLVALAVAASTAAGSAAQSTAGKSLVRVATSAASSGIGRPAPTTGATPVTLVTAAKSLFLGGPQGGVAATVATVGSNPQPVVAVAGPPTATVVTTPTVRRGLPQILTPRMTGATVLSNSTVGTLKPVRGSSPALSQLAAHVTHVAAATAPTGQIPLMAPISVVGHLPTLLSQQFLSPGLGPLAAAAAATAGGNAHHHHHHHHAGATAVVKPLVVVSLPNVVAQPATSSSVGTAQ
uniref:Max-binding protein MNT n=1 Tax=Rhipicephalus pulchellus TaxID=72859 RepID=L7M5W1_RHIPC